jgi:hypothetical protein
MNQPRKNLAESVLARAELFRRGMLFDGVPQFTAQPLEMPAAPAVEAPASPGAADPSQALPAVPGAADALTAGAVTGKPALETLLTP